MYFFFIFFKSAHVSVDDFFVPFMDFDAIWERVHQVSYLVGTFLRDVSWVDSQRSRVDIVVGVDPQPSHVNLDVRASHHRLIVEILL
jgi:catalase (peroxidase I)